MRRGIPVAVAFLSLFCLPSLADIAVGRQDYVIAGRESQVLGFMNEYHVAVNNSTLFTHTGSTVTFTASSDDALIVYDHWEDGFETDPLSPTQTTTFIFRLDRGQTINLNSTNLNETGQCRPSDFTALAAPCAVSGGTSTPGTVDARGNGFVSCTYACSHINLTSGRDAAARRFDAGDRLTSLGGPVTLVHQVFPGDDDSSSPALAVAVEHFSKQSSRDFLTYRVPVGQGASATPATALNTDPFHYARAFVAAYEDDTHVTIDNGSAVVSVTLNAGQSYSTAGTTGNAYSRSRIDETTSTDLVLLGGTRIDADKEIAVTVINAGGSGRYHLDLAAVLPVRAYGRDFLIPTSARDGSNPQRAYVFNPNNQSATITIFSNATRGNAAAGGCPAQARCVTVPANSVATDGGSPGIAITAAAGTYPDVTRLRSDVPIWGLVINDTSSGSRDMSYAMVPTRFLQNEYVLPYTPDMLSGNAIFIAPLEDHTRVYIYPPGSAVPAKVDLDFSGSITATDCGTTSPTARFLCSTADPGYTLRTPTTGYNPFTVGGDSNSVLRFTGRVEPRGGSGTNISNFAGGRIVASAPIFVAYAQDPDLADVNGPLDFGFAIVPPSPLLIEDVVSAGLLLDPPTFSLTVPAEPTSGRATLTLRGTAGSQDLTETGFVLLLDPDALPPESLSGNDIRGSFVLPDASTVEVLGVRDGAAADDFGRRRYVFDFSGVPALNTLQATASLQGSIGLRQGAGVDNPTHIDLKLTATLGGQGVSPSAALVVRTSALSVALGGPAVIRANTTEVYTATVRNSGSTSLTTTLYVPIPEGLSYVAGSGAGCSVDAASNSLVCTLGAIAGGAEVTLPFSMTVQTLPVDTTVSVRARAESGSERAYSAMFTSLVQAPEWELSALVTPTTVPRNGTFSVIGSVVNTSLVPASDAVISVPIPTGLAFGGLVEFDASSGSFAAATDCGCAGVPPLGQYRLTANQLIVGMGTIAAMTSAPARVRVRMSVPLAAPAGDYGVRTYVQSAESPDETGSDITFVTVQDTTTDSNAPNIMFTAPTALEQPTQTPTFQGVVSDASGIASATIQFCARSPGDPSCAAPTACGAPVALSLDAFGAFTHQAAPLASGSYCAVVSATDTALPANSGSAARAFDVTAPNTPVYVSPAAGSSQGPAFAISGSADPNVGIRLTIDSVLYTTTADGAGNWTVNVSGLPTGTQQASVIARDSSNRESVAALRSFVVDATPPAVAFTSPAAGSTQPGAFTISGTAEADAGISLVIDGQSYSTTATGGSWSIAVSGVTTGNRTASVVATDAFGNASAAIVRDFIVDATPPLPPVVTAPTNGSAQAGSFLLSGTAEPNATITATVNDGTSITVLTTTADGAGDFDFALTGLPSGTTSVSLTATDAQGNESTATNVSYPIDATAPAAPVIVAPSEGATVGATSAVTGTAEPGSTLVLVLDDGLTLNTYPGVTVAMDGTWSVPLTGLTTGAYSVSVTATDAVGNESPAETRGFLVDATAPAAPLVTSPADGSAQPGAFTLTGTAEPGAIVTATVSDGTSTTVLTTNADGSGGFSFALTGLPSGTTTVTLTATDAFGNVSPATQVGYAIDASAPSSPVITAPTEGSTLGSADTTVQGTAEPGSVITLVLNDGTTDTTLPDVVVASDGTWSVPLTGLATGTYTVSVVATDAVGNTSPAAMGNFAVDTTAPAAPAVTVTQADGVITVSGTGEPGATVTIVTSTGETVTGTVQPDGSYSIPLSGPYAVGDHSVSVTLTDATGNTSPAAMAAFSVAEASTGGDGDGDGDGDGNGDGNGNGNGDDGEGPGSGSGGVGGDGDGGEDGAGGGDTDGDGNGLDPSANIRVFGGGCQCSESGAGPDASFLLVAAAALLRVMRRRRAR